ncbi:MAG: C4-dicarboxylate ABC transporter, partial [Oscillospiraceae bacterium]|nr:C4-dicarboxylate ABC transporter [Oscillospiraceae bacterium]
VIFWVGFVLYFAALVLIIMKKRSSIFVPEPLTLTTAIFTAPMSLLIVGYFSSFQERSEVLVYIMLAIAILSYIYVTVKMLTTFLKVRFYPTYSAYTFPYVISALAFRLANGFLIERGITLFAPVAQITQWIAVAVVAYVFINYIRYFKFVLKY